MMHFSETSIKEQRILIRSKGEQRGTEQRGIQWVTKLEQRGLRSERNAVAPAEVIATRSAQLLGGPAHVLVQL